MLGELFNHIFQTLNGALEAVAEGIRELGEAWDRFWALNPPGEKAATYGGKLRRRKYSYYQNTRVYNYIPTAPKNRPYQRRNY